MHWITLSHLAVLLMFIIPTATASFLYRASPGGDGVADSGLWGGHLETSDKGQAQNLYQYGITGLVTDSIVMEGLDITSLSYDPVTKRLLMEIDDVASGGFVASASPCPNKSTEMRVIAGNVRLVDDDNPYLLDNNCDWKCGWNAFTQYDGEVYFVLSAVFGNHVGDLRRDIQVRRLNNCFVPEKDPIDIVRVTELNVMQCSEHVATLYSGRYVWPNPELSVWSGGALKAIPAPDDDQTHDLHLYVQLFNRTSTGMQMTLVQVATAAIGHGADVTSLHTTPIESVYGGKWQFRGVGETSYRDGVLCWTATEVLLCGRLHINRLYDVTTMLEDREAYKAGICTGRTSPLPLGYILTGVAIDSSTDPFTVYFGCFTEEPGVGGLGLLRLSIGYSGVTRELLPVTSGGGRVLGGAVFLIDDLATTCSQTSTSLDVDGGTTGLDEDISTIFINESSSAASDDAAESGGVKSTATQASVADYTSRLGFLLTLAALVLMDGIS